MTTLTLGPATVIPPASAEWRDRAACQGHDPELWWPLPRAYAQIHEAKSVCQRDCPVTEHCLRQALAAGEPGVWGGFSELERTWLARGRSPRRCTRCALWFAGESLARRECHGCTSQGADPLDGDLEEAA